MESDWQTWLSRLVAGARGPLCNPPVKLSLIWHIDGRRGVVRYQVHGAMAAAMTIAHTVMDRAERELRADLEALELEYASGTVYRSWELRDGAYTLRAAPLSRGAGGGAPSEGA